MGSSKPSGSTTSTQKTEPWEGQQPFYKEIFGQAQDLYTGGELTPEAYQGQTIAPQSDYTTQSREAIANKALAGSPVTNNAQTLASDTLSGKYLDITKNPALAPGLKSISDAYSKGTAAQTDAAAARSGAYGGSAYKELVGDNSQRFSDSLNSFAGNIYNQERGLQNNALAMSPSINAAGYSDLDRLGGVGASEDAFQQNLINADIEKFNIEDQGPYSALQRYSGLIGGNLGGTTTATSPYFGSNGVGTGLGTAAGTGLGYMFGGPIGGMMGGSIGGSLGGLF